MVLAEDMKEGRGGREGREDGREALGAVIHARSKIFDTRPRPLYFSSLSPCLLRPPALKLSLRS